MNPESGEITPRPIELSDVDDFMEWAGDDKVTQFCLWDTYTCKEQALDYIEFRAIPHPWLRVICQGNKVVGAISVTPPNSGSDCCRAELGYVLAHKYWGKGIATRAVKMAADAVFLDWGHLLRLEAMVDVENLASQRVLEKVGFKREGVLRKYCLIKGRPMDAVVFSILSTEIENK